MTRDRIVNATAELLSRYPLRDIRVAQIGQIAGISSATFYLYFESVREAGLAAMERIEQSTPEILELLQSDWPPSELMAKSRALVNAHFAVWDKHHALLRIRNFMADEGDKRFMEARKRAIEPLHLQLQAKVAELQQDLPPERRLDPPSTASVVLAMLERTAQIIRLPSAHRATRPLEVRTTAFLVACALSGSDPFMLQETAGLAADDRDFRKGGQRKVG